MIEINPSRFKFTPYKHQLAGVKTLLRKKVYGLFWEMRLGKTKAVIDAACTLFDAGELDVVVIVSPAQVKDVWSDKELGEIQKHAWNGHGYVYDARSVKHIETTGWVFKTPCFIVTSFEFLRQEDKFGEFPKVKTLIAALRGKRVWIVIDEASAISNVKALQTKATYQLRQVCERVTELDGTPAGNSTLDLFSKFMIMNKEILGYRSKAEFEKAHTTKTKAGFTVKTRWGIHRPNKITGYTNLELLTERTKDHCEYLKQCDALDMPEKVRSFFSVPLTPKTWKIYKQLRDELIAELDSGTYIIKSSATKVMRLAQLCAGFLGGVASADPDDPFTTTEELSSETTDHLLEWLKLRIAENPEFKVVIWCRWVKEIERLYDRIMSKQELGGVAVQRTYGAVKDHNILHPDSIYAGSPVICIAQPDAARFGVNYSKADTVVYLSQGYNLVTRSQSEDRVQAPNGRKTTLLIDVVVTGPDGQKTIIHDVVKTLANKEQLATRTTDQWRKILSE